jgi:hypothetical protein
MRAVHLVHLERRAARRRVVLGQRQRRWRQRVLQLLQLPSLSDLMPVPVAAAARRRS